MELSSKILDYWRDASIIYYLKNNILEHDFTIELNSLESDCDLEDGYYYLSPCIIARNIYPFLIPIVVNKRKVELIDFSVNSIIVSKKTEDILSGAYTYLIQQLQLYYEELSRVIEVVLFCNNILTRIWGAKINLKKLYIFEQNKLHCDSVENINTVKGFSFVNGRLGEGKIVSYESQLPHASNKFSLNREQKNILRKLNENSNNVSLIEGAFGAGITTIVKNYITQQLARAIIEEKNVPEFYTIGKDGKKGELLFINELRHWFTEEELRSITRGDKESSYLKSRYIEFTNELYSLEVTDVKSAIEGMKKNIIKEIRKLNQGEILKYALDEMNDFFSEKYQNYEGLKVKRNKLSIYIAKFREELNEAKVLLSFWQRQVMNIPLYYRKLCSLKVFSDRVITKNKKYLLSVIDEDRLGDLVFNEVEIEIKKKIYSISKKISDLEIEVADLEKDRSNLISAKSKYAVWQRALNIDDSASEDEKQQSIDTGFCNYLYKMLVWYWLGIEIEQDDRLLDKDNIIIIDYASMCPTFKVIRSIYNAKKIVLVKRHDVEDVRFIPEQIDESLIYRHDLLSDEIDQDELQFLGVGASSGSIWRYFSEIIDSDEILKLSSTYRYSKEVSSLLRKFDVDVNTVNIIQGEVKVIPIEGYDKELVNIAEAQEVIDIYYSIGNESCAIITTTLEQVNYIKSLSKGYIRAYTMEDHISLDAQYNDIILSLVFNGASDFKPFEEKVFWQKIITRAKNRIFIVCNDNLFGSFSHGCMNILDVYRERNLSCIS